MTLDNRRVQMAAFKRAEDGRGYIVRLFNPHKQPEMVRLVCVGENLDEQLRLAPFELSTFRLNNGELTLVDLLENEYGFFHLSYALKLYCRWR